jgi:ring-1,2-phenylacetyl-CoA epoxidase subunit PaaD
VTTVDQVRAAAEAVPDPELPPVTLGMLGVVHDVAVDGARATVDLLPTFAGCPALDAMTDDVRAAVLAVPGIAEVAVRHRFDPPWTSDRISPEGHDALRSFGIAPPDERPRLPLLAPAPRPCPYCGSTDTERDGLFGPTPCRDVRYCRACRQPFEAFKSLG